MIARSRLTVLMAALLLAGATAGAYASGQKQASADPMAKSLVFYSAQGYDGAMAKAFQQKTGIKVNLVDDSTGNIVAKIEAERSNPHWDVAWFDGASTMQALDNQGMLLTGWSPTANYTGLGKSLEPADHGYYPASVTAAAAIAVNTKLVSPADYPTNWSDLLNPVFKNAVGMNDPSISGPTYPYVAGILQLMGEQKAKQFFLDLKKNGLKVFPTNGNTLKALLAGEVKVITIQDSALTEAMVKGDPIKIIYPTSGVTTLPGVIAIDKKAPDMAVAKEFVDFALSMQGQKVMIDPANGGGDSYFNPIIAGLSPNTARQQGGIKWNPLNTVQAADQINAVKSWFHNNIVE